MRGVSKVDRVACPWLIKRSIDPDAELLSVLTDDERLRIGFPIYDAFYGYVQHRVAIRSFEERCDA